MSKEWIAQDSPRLIEKTIPYMTANRRILLNIVATYGRSLYVLVLGLFTARWALQALGQVDFGLYGVVGGLTAFIVYLNGILAGAMRRGRDVFAAGNRQ